MAAAISPDGECVATVADDMRMKLWDAENGKLIFETKSLKDASESIAISRR